MGAVVSFPKPVALSDAEKAALFDLAMQASRRTPRAHGAMAQRDARDLAFLIAALTASHIALRDREDGIV